MLHKRFNILLIIVFCVFTLWLPATYATVLLDPGSGWIYGGGWSPGPDEKPGSNQWVESAGVPLSTPEYSPVQVVPYTWIDDSSNTVTYDQAMSGGIVAGRIQ